MTNTGQCRHVYLFVLKEIKSHISVLSGLMTGAKIQKKWKSLLIPLIPYNEQKDPVRHQVDRTGYH